MSEQNDSILHGPLLKTVITYTIPIILTSILQLMFNAVDLIVVGQFCGSVSVAAVGATGSLNNLLINIFNGLSVGVTVASAQAIGAGSEERIRRAVHTAFAAALVCGAILTIVGLTTCVRLLRMMNTPAEVLPLSTTYMRFYFSGMTFTMVYNFCAAILRAAGDTKSPLKFLFLSGVTNVVLNLFFVIALGMDVAGVALATTISQGISAVLVVRKLMLRKDACRLRLSKVRFFREETAEILRIGLPAGIQSSIFGVANVMVQSSVNSFGAALVSGNAAAGSLEGFIYTTLNAFYQTMINFTGQNAGAKQYKRIYRIFGCCLGCTTIVGIVMSVLFWFFGEPLLGFYITDSPEAIACGMIRMTYVILPYFMCGLMGVSTGALRGIGASITPMIISVIGICGTRIGWILTIFQIPQFHTPKWLYISDPVSWTVTFAAQTAAFFILMNRQIKRAENK